MSEVERLKQEVDRLQEWKDAVIDAAVVNWTYQESHTPREAINALLAQVHREALDPAISEEAAKRKEERDRLTAERDEANAAYRVAHGMCRHKQEEVDRLTAQLGELRAAIDPQGVIAPGMRHALVALAQGQQRRSVELVEAQRQLAEKERELAKVKILTNYQSAVGVLNRALDAESALPALRAKHERLKGYAQHQPRCDKNDVTYFECTCGLDPLLTAQEKD